MLAAMTHTRLIRVIKREEEVRDLALKIHLTPNLSHLVRRRATRGSVGSLQSAREANL